MIRIILSAAFVLALAGGAMAGRSFVFGKAVATNWGGGSASASVSGETTATGSSGNFTFKGTSSGPGGTVRFFGFGTSTGPAGDSCSAPCTVTYP